jgi:hypothetical protein
MPGVEKAEVEVVSVVEHERCEGADGEPLDCGGCINPCDFELKRRRASHTRLKNRVAKENAELEKRLAEIDAGIISDKDRMIAERVIRALKKKEESE